MSKFCCDFFTQYRTTKAVVVHSKVLGIPHRCAQLFIVVYIIIYQICLRLRFLKVQDADGVTKIGLRSPGPHFWNVSEQDRDGVQTLRPLDSISYCRGRNLSYTPRREDEYQCRYFDDHELQRSSPTDSGVFFATRVETIPQRRCVTSPGSQCKRLWSEQGAHEDVFVAGIEDYFLKIDHAIPFDHDGVRYATAENSQGFIKFANESVFHIPCFGDCNYSVTERDFSSWTAYSPCDSRGVENSGCFSITSDFLSVATVLEAAGANLDIHAADEVHSPRALGISLGLDIHYTNMEPWEFWKPPLGRKIKYTYEFSSFRFQQNDRVDYFRDVAEQGSTRVLKRYTGILIQTTIKGKLGTYSLIQFLITLAVSTGLLTVAEFLVPTLLCLLPKTGCVWLRNASRMYEFYKKDESPTHEEFQGQALDADGLLQLARRAKKRQAHEVTVNEEETSGSSNDIEDGGYKTDSTSARDAGR